MGEWRRVPCDASSCPEWRRIEEIIWLRSDRWPQMTVGFSLAEWKALGAAFKNGDLDLDTP
jgi:hypothetical protein